MVNNNTSQNTTVSTVIKSESSIYLKKSELPKNISSFKNDVGYISTATLDAWLKEHSYLSKNEVNALIKRANLVVLDTVNKSYDDEAIGRLNNDIINIKGEIVAIKDRLTDVESGYITIEQAGAFAKRSEIRTLTERINDVADAVDNISIDIDTSNFATKDSIPTKVSDLINDANYLTQHQSLAKYAKKTDIPDVSNFISRDEITSIDSLATKEWVEDKGYLTQHQSLSKYAKKTDLPDVSNFATKDEIPSVDDMATKTWVKNQGYLTQHQSLAKYAKKTELPNMEEYVRKDDVVIPEIEGLATKEWVEDKGYLTQHQSLSKYAKKTDLPVLDGYATQDWVMSQGFLTEGFDLRDYAKKSDVTNTLSGYVKRSELNNYAKKNSVYDKNEADNIFLSKDGAAGIYLKKEDAASTYMRRDIVYRDFLQIEDYRGFKDATLISDKYQDNTVEEFLEVVNDTGVRNGFYFVNRKYIIVVKDNSVMTIFEDGASQFKLEWIEEESE